jgi:TonB family protein
VLAIARQIGPKIAFAASNLKERAAAQGTLVLDITLKRDGRLVEAHVSHSSEEPEIDKGVLNAARLAAPYPPVPAEFRGETVTVVVPIYFAKRT